jgi:hypothetical protein
MIYRRQKNHCVLKQILNCNVVKHIYRDPPPSKDGTTLKKSWFDDNQLPDFLSDIREIF